MRKEVKEFGKLVFVSLFGLFYCAFFFYFIFIAVFFGNGRVNLDFNHDGEMYFEFVETVIILGIMTWFSISLIRNSYKKGGNINGKDN